MAGYDGDGEGEEQYVDDELRDGDALGGES